MQVGNLEFDVRSESSDVTYLDQNYSSLSYSFTCKSEDRLANIPGGPLTFAYKNHSYPFDSSSCKLSKFRSSIIEVSVLYLLYS